MNFDKDQTWYTYSHHIHSALCLLPLIGWSHIIKFDTLTYIICAALIFVFPVGEEHWSQKDVMERGMNFENSCMGKIIGFQIDQVQSNI